jgi:hypothetical protein
MAQTGYTPIQLYYSPTTTNTPLAANLATGELAINAFDGKLFYKDTSNAVQVIGWKTTPATAGGTGQTVYTVGDVLYASTTTALSKLADVATGSALISGGVGVAPSYGKIGLTTHVSGTLPIANGGTGTSSTTFTNLTTNVTGTLPVANGGTGVTTSTGSGNTVLSSGPTLASPTFTTPVLGTPTSGDLSSCVGIPLPRMVAIASGTSVTLNSATTDIGTQVNTQAAGTLTMNAPTGTPVNGQKIIFRLTSSNVQTFSWNSSFSAGSSVTLPVVSSGSGLTDYMGFLYNSTTSKWQMLASSFGY